MTQIIASNGINLSVEVAGEGPLVILMHGWPELGLSWRHQVPALTAAGYRVAVPDMRGYGATDKPLETESYRLDNIGDDMGGLARALGAERWVAVGHDWGAPAAWRCALRFPQAVAAVFCLSVPHAAPTQVGFLDLIEMLYPDRFFYIRYFQDIGVAEAEFESADWAQALKRVYYMGSGEGVANRSGRHMPRDSAYLPGLDDPPPGPLPFMSDEELAAYAKAFRNGGFRGPLSWYRNFPRNAADARAYGDNIIRQPAGFLAGDREMVLAMLPGQLEHQRRNCADLRVEISLPGAGHWVQQERPAQVNAALLEFLAGVRNVL
jgi:pimeloyl-ACP methyl ester carboxylesterase